MKTYYYKVCYGLICIFTGDRKNHCKIDFNVDTYNVNDVLNLWLDKQDEKINLEKY